MQNDAIGQTIGFLQTRLVVDTEGDLAWLAIYATARFLGLFRLAFLAFLSGLAATASLPLSIIL